MLIPSFSVKRIAAMRPGSSRRSTGSWTRWWNGPPAELVGAFALPVPSMVICALLGVPYADHEFFEEQSRRLLRGPTSEEAEARDELDAYFSGLIERKRRTPATDSSTS